MHMIGCTLYVVLRGGPDSNMCLTAGLTDSGACMRFPLGVIGLYCLVIQRYSYTYTTSGSSTWARVPGNLVTSFHILCHDSTIKDTRENFKNLFRK